MNIVIAPDSFKENMTSLQVARAIEQGIRRVRSDAGCTLVPMADGGEGTVQSLVDATGGRIIRTTVAGPLGRKVTARYGMLADKKTAVIEMAQASGLHLVRGRGKNPMRTSSYGTGELIRHALDLGAGKIIVGIGGSATNDGGTGMAQALGIRFRDAAGHVIRKKGCGGMLATVHSIDMDGLDGRIAATEFIIACDVDNPLCGKRGASAVFGPQKGATASMVEKLDAGLANLARVISRDLKLKVANLPGAGAAGGLGAGLLAFTGARMQPGIDIVMQATKLESHIRKADLVITGEGRIDAQTAFGKTPAGVARLAGKYRVPVIAIGGSLADDAALVFKHGIDAVEAAVARDMTLDEALAVARRNISNAAERVMRLLQVGGRLK